MYLWDEIFVSPFWNSIIFGNSLRSYALAGVALLAIILFLKFVQVVILSRLRKLAKETETDIDDTLIEIADSIKPPLYAFLAFYFVLRFLSVNDFIRSVVDFILLVWIVYQAIIVAQIVIDYFIKRGIKSDTNNKHAVRFMSNLAKAGLWILGVILILQNTGVNVSSLLAGLGIGGIAVALALQNILGDLFSSFAIYFDKPFVIGDFIQVGERSGTVEKIGIKTTRLRSLQGEEVVISNKDLTSSTIQNFKRLEERRVLLKFGVVYDTQNRMLRKIPTIVKEVVKSVSGVRFDRAHFVSFSESSLDFEVAYHVESKEYEDYLNAQQSVNLKLKRGFEKEKIEMAYPTQTIFLSRQ